MANKNSKKKTVAKKPASKKTVVKKTTSKKPAPKKAVRKTSVKAAVKKTVAKKPAAKKAATKKPVAKVVKPAAKAMVRGTKKVVVSKNTAKKVEIRKAPAPSKLAPKTAAKVVDRKGPVTLVNKPQAPRPELVSGVKPLPVKAPAAVSKAASKGFAVGEYVVYPTHGVGKITALEVETIGEHQLKVFVIMFEKDKMTLRVPVGRAEAAGLRAISPMDQITRALATLKGRAKIARGMWSRRAQEYESKINSGNLVAIAEVVRDLHKNVDQSERSYSERMIYETALHRLVGEVAAAERTAVSDMQDRLLKVLRKQAA